MKFCEMNGNVQICSCGHGAGGFNGLMGAYVPVGMALPKCKSLGDIGAGTIMGAGGGGIGDGWISPATGGNGSGVYPSTPEEILGEKASDMDKNSFCIPGDGIDTEKKHDTLSASRSMNKPGYSDCITHAILFEKDEKADNINRPSHYISHPSGVECIQITEHMSFNLGNVIKYLWRADEKGAPIDDLRKARWYLDREIDKRETAHTLAMMDKDKKAVK